MISRRLRRIAIFLVACAGFSTGLQSQTARGAWSQGDVERAMTRLSNWGRWGTDDRLGTVNLLTPDRRKAAAALVTDGVPVSLARDLNPQPSIDNPAPFIDRVSPSVEGQFNVDEWTVGIHGFGSTHLDALSHVFYRGQMFNGVPQSSVTPTSVGPLAVATMADGLVGRGVLVDIPWLKGLPYLEPGTAVLPADLDAWERRTNVRVGAGDIVFVRTGRWARHAAAGPWDIASQAAGLDASAAEWLKNRDVAVLGSDGAGEVVPSSVAGVGYPLHDLLIVAMGMPMIDQCDLEAVARMVQTRGRVTFFVVAAPLRARGGTGSPVNVIALF